MMISWTSFWADNICFSLWINGSYRLPRKSVFARICHKTLCSQSSNPTFLHMKFDQDWITGLWYILLWSPHYRYHRHFFSIFNSENEYTNLTKILFYSTRQFVLCLTLCYFVLVFFSPFSITITSLGVERANLSAFHRFVWFVLVWFCRIPLPLGVWEGLRFVIVALPGLFSYLFDSN